MKKFIQNESVLNPIYETMKQVKSHTNGTTLIGFAGAPFRLSYMIEGGTSKDLKKTKKMMVSDKRLFVEILDTVTEITINYLENQVKAGAEALQIFDTWINHLDWDSCNSFSAKYVKKIIHELRVRDITVPITFFGKQTSVFYPLYEDTGVNVISFDWNGNLAKIDQELNSKIGIQGNLDPFILYGPQSVIEEKVYGICNSISQSPIYFQSGP